MITPIQHAKQQKHTQGKLQVMDGALLCENINTYGNWIVASCDRERTPEDITNLNRLAHCWNVHDLLVEACQTALDNLTPIYCSDHLVMKRLRAALLAATGKDGV